MASLTGKKIKDTYDGLLKVEDNEQISDVKKKITDGFGNESGLAVDNAGNVDVQSDLNVGGDAVVDQNLDVAGSLSVTGTISDSQGLKGASGQLLSSTNVGTEWVDISGTYATKSELQAEVSDRENADTQLQTNIDNEANARVIADNELSDDINAEATARANADTELDGKIAIEASERVSADSLLQSNIDAETSARISADDSLQSNINTEEGARIAGDQALQAQISNNDTAINDLENDLAQEVTDRTNADQALQDAIDAEQSARINGDNNLQANLTSEVNARTSADSVLQGQINSNDSDIAQLNSDLSAEETARISGDANLQTQIDNLDSTLVNDFVPYTGATDNVDLGSYTLATNSVRLNGLTETDGTITWNQNEGCLQVHEGNTQLQIGQEIYFHVRNESTTNTIPNGTAVMVTGTLGASGIINVAPMDATAKPDPKYFIGIATEDIAPEQEGKVTWFGKVRDVDTSGFNEGDTLYVGANGVLTNTKFPLYHVECALAINSKNNGTIFVRAVEKQYLSNITDINVSDSYTDHNKALVYDGVNNYWYAGEPWRDDIIRLNGETDTLSTDLATTASDVSDLSDDLALETANRVSGDSTLQANLDAEALTRATADSDLQDNIDAEETARTSADTILQANIDAEITNRQDADDVLQGNIDDEASTREATDLELQDDIDAEAVLRADGDTALQANIDAEALARSTADTDLQAQITSNDLDINDLYASKEDVANKGVANGYASLDANAKVPTSQLPDSILGQLAYQGTWDADTDTPTLPDPTTVQGNYYVVSVEGTYETILYHVGDWIVSNGTIWEKVDNTDAVTSVFGRLGNVVANEADYSGFYPLIQDLTDEETARVTADANLQANIDQEVLDRQAGDTALQSNIDAEVSERQDGDTALQAQIDSNDTDIESNSDAIVQEVVDRTTADALLQAQIDGNASDIAALDLQAVTDVGNTTTNSIETAGATINGTLDANRVDIGADVNGVLNVWDVNSDEIFRATSTGTQIGGLSASRNLKVYGDAEADAFIKDGGTSSEFLKADGSVDSTAYITINDVPVPSNANVDINAGGGLDGGGSLQVNQATNTNINISHADTSTQTDVVGATNTFVDGVTLDTYGHVTGLTTQSVTIPNPNNATITLEGGTNMTTVIGSFTTDQGTNATLTINHGDTSTLDGGYGSLGDRPYQVSVDPNGHVVAVDTAPLFGFPLNNGVEVLASAPMGYDFGVGHGDTSTLQGTYGSGQDSTKIDTITLDEFGHVTGITTGATGDITGVTATNGLVGGGATGSVTIEHANTSNLDGQYGGFSVNDGYTYRPTTITVDDKGHTTGIGISRIIAGGDDVIRVAPTPNTGQEFTYYLDTQGLQQRFANTSTIQVGFSAGQIALEAFPNGLMLFNGDLNVVPYALPPDGFQLAFDLNPRLKVSSIDYDMQKGLEDGNGEGLRFTSNVTGLHHFEGASGSYLDTIKLNTAEGIVHAKAFGPNFDAGGSDAAMKFYGNAAGLFKFYGFGQEPLEIADFGSGAIIRNSSAQTIFGHESAGNEYSEIGLQNYVNMQYQFGGGKLYGGKNAFGDPMFPIIEWNYDFVPAFGNLEAVVGNVYVNMNLEVSRSYGTTVYTDFSVFGTKNFRIDHPIAPETHDLVHSVIESNRGDVMYRGKLRLVKGKAEVNLDEFIGMMQGTFEALTKDVQVFTTNEDGWTQVKGRVTGSKLEIFAQDSECADEVSWLVMGERNDSAYLDSNNVDENGHLILEPANEGTQAERQEARIQESEKRAKFAQESK